MTPTHRSIVAKGTRGWLMWSADHPDEVVAIVLDRDFDMKRELRALRPTETHIASMEGKRRCLMRFPFRRFRRVGFTAGVSGELLRTLREAADDAGVR